MTKKPKGIHYKLFKVMGIQLVLISLVTLLGVYVAGKVVEDVLVKQALEGEAAFFWEHYEKDADFNLPNTLNLTGYFSHTSSVMSIPKHLNLLEPGYHRVNLENGRPLVHVSDNNGKRLYLVFEEGQVSRLAFYFGIAPLAFVLLVIYLPAWVSYMMSKRAISPVIKLAKKMDEVQVSASSDLDLDFSDMEKNADAEVISLLGAFKHYASQVREYVKREKNFTRYASHELRTPLAVMKGSVALLEKQSLEAHSQKVLSRMKMVILDMEHLIESLLILSRNQSIVVPNELVNINQLIEREVAQLKEQSQPHSVSIELIQKEKAHLKIPERLLSICLSNIIGNAINYSPGGHIKIIVTCSGVTVKDNGIGMSEEILSKIFAPFYRGDREDEIVRGYGLGMSIVKTICDRMNWQLDIKSQLGKGTSVKIGL